MEINAEQVRLLRETTGIGMMQCKAALVEANGDMDKAVENLRKQGQVTAAKRAGKAAKEGIVSILIDQHAAIMYEVNSETDFVARNDDFISFVKSLGKELLAKKPDDIIAAKAVTLPDMGNLSADAKVTELIGKIGEKISFRRYSIVRYNNATERVFSYVHGGGKIGILITVAAPATSLDNPALAELGKDLAMQVAAANAIAPNRNSITADIIAKEKEIYLSQAQTSGKPEKVWEKMVEGKLEKFYKETCLTEQAYIRNPEITVNARIAETEKTVGGSISVVNFVRFELGAE